MGMTCYKVGLIGYGRSGRDIHSWAIDRSDGRFEVAAISDVTDHRRIQASDEHSCPVYSDYRDMLKNDKIDLYINTAFSNLHVPISIDLLNHGKAVLCEKPLTSSIDEFEELAETVRRTGAYFTVFNNKRYDPICIKAREWFNSGLIGEPIQISLSASNFNRRWDWQMSLAHGGGILMVAGVHILDIALQLVGTGYDPKIFSSLKHYGAGDADNYAKVLMTADNAPTIDIECSYFDAFKFKHPYYTIQGEYGTIACTEDSIEVKYYDPAEVSQVDLDVVPLQDSKGNPAFCKEDLPFKHLKQEYKENRFHASFLGFYDELYNSLNGKAEVPVSIAELRQQVRVLNACYKSEF